MDADGEESQASVKTEQKKGRRRMYRDPDRRVLGGVCGGLGAYFNIDPVTLRIITVALLFVTAGNIFWVYLILWIAVPKAATTAQRLEMRGEEATVSNIEKSIKEEVKDVKDSFNRFTSSDTYEKGKDGVSRFGDLLYNIAKVSLKILAIIVGVGLIIAGFFGVVGFLSTMIIGHSILGSDFGPEFHIQGIFDHFVGSDSVLLIGISVALITIIPLLAILFIGTKMIFRYKTNNKIIGLASLGIWLVALFTLILVSVGQVDNFKKKTSTTSTINIEKPCKTLTLELGTDTYDSFSDADVNLDRMKIVSADGKDVLLGEPRLDIEKSSGDQFTIVLKKKARGKSQSNAQQNIEEIVYCITQKDSLVTFDPYYSLREGSKWRNQEVDIVVKVPVGKTVYLGEKLDHIMVDVENISNTYDGDTIGKYWIMTEEGLRLKEK